MNEHPVTCMLMINRLKTLSLSSPPETAAMMPSVHLTTPCLQFRGVSDSLAKHHLEGSECCLIHADYQRVGREGVWLNPNVRVGYNPAAYEAVNPDNGGLWPTWREKVRGVWQNRLSRWPSRLSEKWQVKRQVRAWEAEKEENHEQALGCLINEMQVLVENGWQHV